MGGNTTLTFRGMHWLTHSAGPIGGPRLSLGPNISSVGCSSQGNVRLNTLIGTMNPGAPCAWIAAWSNMQAGRAPNLRCIVAASTSVVAAAGEAAAAAGERLAVAQIPPSSASSPAQAPVQQPIASEPRSVAQVRFIVPARRLAPAARQTLGEDERRSDCDLAASLGRRRRRRCRPSFATALSPQPPGGSHTAAPPTTLLQQWLQWRPCDFAASPDPASSGAAWQLPAEGGAGATAAGGLCRSVCALTLLQPRPAICAGDCVIRLTPVFVAARTGSSLPRQHQHGSSSLRRAAAAAQQAVAGLAPSAPAQGVQAVASSATPLSRSRSWGPGCSRSRVCQKQRPTCTLAG